jgi:hypothetical protein
MHVLRSVMQDLRWPELKMPWSPHRGRLSRGAGDEMAGDEAGNVV